MNNGSDKQSGFEDEDSHGAKQIRCRDPEHNPPMHLHIPFGKVYRHVCPSCGYTIRLHSNSATYKVPS